MRALGCVSLHPITTQPRFVRNREKEGRNLKHGHRFNQYLIRVIQETPNVYQTVNSTLSLDNRIKGNLEYFLICISTVLEFLTKMYYFYEQKKRKIL